MKRFEKGLFTDCVESEQPENTYRFAKNVVDTNLLGTKENEDGFTDLAVSAPYTNIGTVPIDGDNVVVFSTNNTDCEIGLLNLLTSVYSVIYNDPALNFNTASPIQAEYRKDVNGDRVVTFTDVRNTLRIINIDDTSGVNDVEDLNAFQDVNNPSISTYSISNFGGSLPTSAIIPITKYKNRDGSETNWFVHDHTFYINDDSTALAFNENDGAAPGTITNKVANFTLSDCDTRYDTIVIGYIKIQNSITTAYRALERSNANVLNISLTGSESTTDLTLDEILTPTANYNTVGTIGQLMGQLYAANLTTEPIPDLQPSALGVRIDYTHSLVNIISNTNSNKDSLPPGFMPGEVYAFYLGVELNKGGWAFYHVPGRGPTFGETSTITANGMTYKLYQVNDTSDNGLASTNMGFWENDNEVYPNDSAFNGSSLGNPDLRNDNVRHHRMPRLDELTQEYYSGDSSVGVTHLIKLGISVSNVIIPADIQSKIKRWKIFFAKKSANDSIVVGSDLLQFGASTPSDSNIRWGTGGNWDMEAESATPGAWENFDMTDFDTIRGHSLDLIQSPITPTYALFNYALQRSNLNTQYSGFRSVGARMTICGEDRGQVASAVIDFTVPTQTTRTDSSFIKRLDNFSYLPPNALSGKFKTQYTEGCFVADINSPSTSFNFLTILRLHTRSSGAPAVSNQFGFAPTYSGTLGEHTMYMQYCRLLSNAHVSFMQQDLVPVEGYSDPSVNTGTFQGGDAFMCYLSYLTAAPQNSNPTGTIGAPYEQGVRMWKAYIGYSKYNFNFRYQTQGDIGTYYHGKTDVRTLFSPNVTDTNPNYTTLIKTDQSLNLINYDPTMNAANTLSVGVIFNPDIIEATEFPNTVIWSPVQNEESKEFSWRSFPSSNRYVIPKNKGDIINIQGINNKELVINTEESFFRTRSNVKLQTDTGEVFLKTATIFDIPPEELVPTETGYAGCQHKFACSVTTGGYLFPDDKRGKVFLYNGESLEEISSNGNAQFFSNFMDGPADNPFVTTGYTTGFDLANHRIIITKKNGDTSWTASYNPVRKTWICFHDYTPDYMFNTVSGKLYSSKSSGFHLQEGGAKGTYYGVTYPSYIDLTFNPAPDQKKLAYALNWDTKVYPNTYVSGQPDQNLDYNTTCTHITMRSLDHCTGRIPIALTSSIYDVYSSNLRNQDGIWSYDEIRDFTIAQGFIQGFYQNFNIDATKLNTNLDWYEQRRFIDKFVTCRLEFDNLQDKRWILVDANLDFKPVPQ